MLANVPEQIVAARQLVCRPSPAVTLEAAHARFADAQLAAKEWPWIAALVGTCGAVFLLRKR